MSLNIVNIGEGMPDKQLTFGQHLQRWIDEKEGMNARQLAQKIGKSPAYVGYLLKDENPSTKKPIQIKKPLADKIAEALGRRRGEVYEAANLRDPRASKTVDENTERLLEFYADLPPESKLDMLAVAEALWRRRRPGSSNHLIPVRQDDKEAPQRKTGS